jgi:hypothetical protein
MASRICEAVIGEFMGRSPSPCPNATAKSALVQVVSMETVETVIRVILVMVSIPFSLGVII